MVVKKRHQNRSRFILSYMSKKENTGVVMTADDILAGLRWPETDRIAVVSALSNMVRRAFVLESPSRGSYVYTGRPIPKPDKEKHSDPVKEIPKMFEYVGTLRNGDQLVRDENNNIYRFEQI